MTVPRITSNERRLAIQKQVAVAPPDFTRGERRLNRVPRRSPNAVQGAVTLVTGAAHGIGRAIATAMADAEAVVVAVDQDGPALAALAAELRSRGATCTAFTADVRSEQAIHQVIDAISRSYGRLNVVVNNAGVINVVDFQDLTLPRWRKVFSVNVDGVLNVTLAARGLMKASRPDPEKNGRRGIFINVSSLAADLPRRYQASYSAAKAALNSMSRSAAESFMDEGIVTSVAVPGNVREGMWQHLTREIAQAEGRTEAAVESERYFQPADEFASLICDVAAVPGFSLNGALILPGGEVADI